MGQWISVFLQAAGVLLLLWAVLGWLLRGFDRGGAVVYACGDGRPSPEAFLRYYSFLKGAGLTRMPLVLIDCGLSQENRRAIEQLAAGRPVYICTEAELAERMRMEGTQDGGFGTAAG